MKKLLLGLLLLIPSISFADTATTGNPQLILVSTGSVDRTRSWGDKVNENFSMISSSMAGLLNGTINMDLTGSTQTKLGGAIFGGDVTATKFHGDGSGLSGVATSGASTGVVLAGLLASTYTYTSVSTLSVTFAESSDLFIVAYASSIMPQTYGLNPVLTFRFNGDGGSVYTSQYKIQASSFTVEFYGDKNPYYSRSIYMKMVNNKTNVPKNIFFTGNISSAPTTIPDNLLFNGVYNSTSRITSVQMFTSWATGKLGASLEGPSFIEVYQMGGISTGATSGIDVMDEEVPTVSKAVQLNFKGAGVSVAANGSTATITINGGSGSLDSSSTNTWTGSQTFQSSITFVNGNEYLLASTYPATNVSTMSVSFPAKNNLRIVIYSSGVLQNTVEPGVLIVRFNEDFLNGTPNNIYQFKNYYNHSSQTGVRQSSVSLIQTSNPPATNVFAEIKIANNGVSTTTAKSGYFLVSSIPGNTIATAPDETHGTFTYSSGETPITSVQVFYWQNSTHGAGMKLKSGLSGQSYIKVFGSDSNGN